jgi:hypothetical protein
LIPEVALQSAALGAVLLVLGVPRLPRSYEEHVPSEIVEPTLRVVFALVGVIVLTSTLLA